MIASNVCVGSRCGADSPASGSRAAALLTTTSIVPYRHAAADADRGRAVAGEPVRDRLAHRPRGAGDQGDLSVETAHARPRQPMDLAGPPRPISMTWPVMTPSVTR
jgi:hypothetical protein